MLPLKFDDALRYSDFCCRLIEFNSNIVLAAIINKRGRILEIQRKVAFSCLGDKELEMLFMQRTLQTTMIKESDDKLGTFAYTLTKREKFYEYTMQLDEGILLMIIDSVSSLTEIVSIIDEINQKFSADFKMIPVLAA
jgi:hypothetical protein